MEKWCDNPYQTEYWEAQRQKDQIDNNIACWVAKITAFLLALGVAYLLLKR